MNVDPAAMRLVMTEITKDATSHTAMPTPRLMRTPGTLMAEMSGGVMGSVVVRLNIVRGYSLLLCSCCRPVAPVCAS